MKKKTRKRSKQSMKKQLTSKKKCTLWITALLGLAAVICGIVTFVNYFTKTLFDLISNGDLEIDDED